MQKYIRTFLNSLVLSSCFGCAAYYDSFINSKDSARLTAPSAPNVKVAGIPTEVPEGYPYFGTAEAEGLATSLSIFSEAPNFTFASNSCTGLSIHNSSGLISGELNLVAGQTCEFIVLVTQGTQTIQSNPVTISITPTLTMTFSRTNIQAIKGQAAQSTKLVLSSPAPFATKLNYRLTSMGLLSNILDGIFSSGIIEVPAGATEVEIPIWVPGSSTLATTDYQTFSLENGVKTAKPNFTTVLSVNSAPTFSEISVGMYSHGCGISSGELYCWGTGSNGQIGTGVAATTELRPVKILGLSNWQKISAGTTNTCGIESGSLYCWGSDANGEAGNGATVGNVTTPQRVGLLSNWQVISTNSNTTCGIESGLLYCWGIDSFGQIGNGVAVGNVISPTQIGVLANWQAVAVGMGHVCGIESGELYCWGWNGYGQVGNGAVTANVESPVKIGTLTHWQSISADGLISCGIESGELYCWGADGNGQVGNGPATGNITAPLKIGTSNLWTWVTVDQFMSCGIDSGKLFCWGTGQYGKLGLGPAISSVDIPTQVGTSSAWSRIDASNNGVCGIDAGKPYCWGRAIILPFGIVSSSSQITPVSVGVGNNWQMLASARRNTCGIESGRMYCWGNFNVPTKIGNQTNWLKVAANGEGNQICGIAAGELFCWNGDSEIPIRVGSSANWTAITVGSVHNCGINLGKLYCWGANYNYQLGFGLSTDVVAEPIQVGTSATWQFISAGYDHTCGIDNGFLYCWGRDVWGMVGNGAGASTDVMVPEQIGSMATWQSLSLEKYYTCGIAAGQLYCWGAGGAFQLGNGVSGAVHAPLQIGVSSTWQKVDPGSYHNCGIDAGRLFCWGTAYSGQFGNGTTGTTVLHPPTQIGLSTAWTDITSGETHSCGINNGEAFCWGANGFNANVLGRTIDFSYPFAISEF